MSIVDMKFYDIYYLCNIASNLIYNADIDLAPTLANFFEIHLQLKPSDFDKFSALHGYCHWVVDVLLFQEDSKRISRISEEVGEFSKYNNEELFAVLNKKNINLWFDNIINHYQSKSQNGGEFTNIIREEIAGLSAFDISEAEKRINDTKKHNFSKLCSFHNWLIERHKDYEFLETALDDYIEEIGNKNIYLDTLDMISLEMFYVLFGNRYFLYKFNDYMAGCHEYEIKRSYVPQWVKRAVFYRDRGRCVLCNKDLSGVIDVSEDYGIQYDHMVSLEDGGLNDISNLQLLCEKCNHKKGASSGTGTNYRYFYDI